MVSHVLSYRSAYLLLVIASVVSFVVLFGNPNPEVSKELGFYSLSPLGESTGRSVPASCPSNLHDSANYGQSCAATNACNQTNYGVYQCGGSGTVCSVGAPAMPNGYGTACTITNNCGGGAGDIQGVIGCNGTCQATSGGNGFGTACQSSANSCGMRTNGSIRCDGSCSATLAPSDAQCISGENPPTNCELRTTPSQIFKNARTILSWSSSGTGSCTITGRASAAGNATLQVISSLPGNGSITSNPLSEDADFTLTCTNSAGSCSSDPDHVRVIGTMTWLEF